MECKNVETNNVIENEIPEELRSINSNRSEEKENIKMTLNCLLSIIVLCTGVFSFGTTMGYSAPAGPKMMIRSFNSQLVISEYQKTWFDGILSIGAMFGSLFVGSLCELLGFKLTVILNSLCFTAGWLIITYASVIEWLYTGRFLTGYAVGMVTFLHPIYAAELSPPKIRGVLTMTSSIGLGCGMLFDYSTGAFLSWQWLATANAFFSVLYFLFSLYIPEIPRWLISKKRKNDAIKTLLWLRDKNADINAEIHEIEQLLHNERKISLLELKQPHIYKPILITLPLMILQQFSGINAVLLNSVELFGKTMPHLNPNLASVLLVLIQLSFAFPIMLLIDRLGRRTLFLISAIIMAISNVTFGISYLLQQGYDWLPFTSMIFFILGFNSGVGPLPYILMAEIIPNNARSYASGMALLANWGSSFIVSKEFLDLKNTLTPQGTFWFFGSCCVINAIFAALVVPETKKKTLEDISKMFQKKYNLNDITEININ